MSISHPSRVYKYVGWVPTDVNKFSRNRSNSEVGGEQVGEEARVLSRVWDEPRDPNFFPLEARARAHKLRILSMVSP